MENLDRIDIQTTSSEGQSVQTVVNNGPINLTTQVSDVSQIQTVMQENVSPISSIINNPFVEVTSVNGQTGDVITEPVMEDFRTNHYYLANTIVNYNGMLYWAKNTFTSTNVFDADDWYTLDIASSKVLTGQLQKTSWRRSVVALCQVSTTANTGLNSYTSGRLAFHRANGLSGAVEINVQAENQYVNAYYFNFDYYSNLNLLDGTADIETAAGFRPCTFKYNNVWYGGIEVFIDNAEFNNITFDGAGNFGIFGLDYYSVAHGTTAASILNQEVYNSLNYTQWTLSRSNFYADSFFANSGRLKKPGGYISTLPSKTGTLAQTSDIGNATLTIQRNGTNVDTFTANATSNKTINISVPTNTNQLTNGAGFVTRSVGLSELSNDNNFLRGSNSQTISPLPSFVSTSMLNNSAVTTIKINDGAVTKAKLANSIVDSSKLDWANLLSSQADGQYILTKSGNTIQFAHKPEYERGDVLVVAVNTAPLDWHGTTKTKWVDGSWTQYGPMAVSSGAHTLVITTPEDETWDVKLHHITGTVKISSAWGHSGIWQSSTFSGMDRYLTTCLVANGDLFLHQETETVVTIPPNTTLYFGVWVRTNSTTNNLWYGGGPTTATGGDFNFGNSCVLDATLIARRSV